MLITIELCKIFADVVMLALESLLPKSYMLAELRKYVRYIISKRCTEYIQCIKIEICIHVLCYSDYHS